MNEQQKHSSLTKKAQLLSQIKSAGTCFRKLLKPDQSLTLEEWIRLESKPTRKKETYFERGQ